MTTRIVDVKAGHFISEDIIELRPFEDMLWMSILESLGAYQMYRQSMQTRVNRIAVLTFLFHNKEFPRSLPYCIENIRYNLSCLANNDDSLLILKHFGKIIQEASMSEMDNDILHGFIDQLQINIGTLHNSITKTYFPDIIEQKAS